MYSVEFVLDYVQLRFDGDEIKGGPVVLNSYVWPRVDDGVRSWREADLGYADALRGLIPATVRSTAESTKTGLRLEFDRRAIVIQPAIEEVYVEIAVLQGFDDGSWTVWHPGEGCFGDLGRDE
ncbi:hypothetical protein [Aeromicrobium sp. Leaf350]|uniref:hypothetical protein n=1 Tax=Aeromicrobium sp. Leaf350 TaxID=2876565 RepID=UPI001E4BB45B|nr:hypothetical protein [Aeromicrobium sp. Leaf350]